MNNERSLSVIGRRIGIRGACFAHVLLAFLLISPQWCVCQLLPAPDEHAETGTAYSIREITIDNWNIGLTGFYADLVKDDSTAIVWRDYPVCGPRRMVADKSNAMLHSVSKPLDLKPNSHISFTHGLSFRGVAMDSLPSQFPDINLCWRLRLADDRTGEILATLDSMSLEPRRGYDACKGFFTPRFTENVRVYFGNSLESLFKGAMHLVLDLQPMMLAGMDYNYQDTGLDHSYSAGLDNMFGYCLMDTVRARGTQLLDVAPCGPGMLGVDIALTNTRLVRMYRRSGNQRQSLFIGPVLEGYSRILVPAEATDSPCTYELESDAGDVLASFVHQSD